MARPAQYAVLKRDASHPPVAALKRAFASFSNLTETDAIRLAGDSHGFFIRQLRREAAQALQRALQAEGVAAVMVPEDDIPALPAGKALPRLDLTPDALVVYDVLGRTRPIPWQEIRLVAAGIVQHFEVTRTRKEETKLGFSIMSGVEPKKVSSVVHKVESGMQLVLEIMDGSTRYQIDAQGFPFKYVIDRPDLALAQKYVWLVREICGHATSAVVNEGARCLVEGSEAIPNYLTRQSLTDEMSWLLWHAAQPKPTGR